ncbi:MAG: FIG00672531: hypothetical protein, partial [uncultured Friedmanniella sp.]
AVTRSRSASTAWSSCPGRGEPTD